MLQFINTIGHLEPSYVIRKVQILLNVVFRCTEDKILDRVLASSS